MTVAIVLEVFLPIVNGVITTTINLAENLKKRGHNVIFIVASWKAFDKPDINGIPIYYIPSLPTYMYPGIRLVFPWNRHVGKILKKEKVDILHITGPWLLSWSAIQAARKNNIPVVQVFHTLIYEDTYIYYGIRLRFLIPAIRVLLWKYIGAFVKRSNLMTAPSNHACKVLQKQFPLTEIMHILNGIDLNTFASYDNFDTLVSNYPSFNTKTFLFVGRLGEEKSVSVLLKAFYLAHMADPELRLFIVGDGPGKKDYEKTVRKNKLEGSVFFLGRLPHKELIHSGLIHHARAMVTASITENQPITIIEAIACGTPIIIPNVEGINELLHDNGMSFPSNNEVSFAEKMVELAGDDQLYEHYKAESGKLRMHFDGMKIAEDFETLYTELTKAKPNNG